MAWVAVVVIAALTGSGTALLVDRMRAEVRRFDAGLADLDAQVHTEHAHTWLRYAHYQFCRECGLREYQSSNVERDGAR